MRTIGLFVVFLLVTHQVVVGQTAAPTKIYFFSSRGRSIRTTRNVADPIRVNHCTLLETNLDSLGFQILPDMTVYVPFERGHTYYFRDLGGRSVAETSLTSSTEQEFWLNVHVFGTGKFRHYVLDRQTGLKLAEEKR